MKIDTQKWGANIACDDNCWKISSKILDLQSDREGADTHLHAKHAANECVTSVLIISEDSDVMV